MNKKRFYIVTFGCQMNVRDTEVIVGLLQNAGYTIVGDHDEADIVIFNTCSVRQHAEDKVWSGIGSIAGPKAKRAKKKIIGVVGCMAQNYREAIFERAPAVDFVVGPSDIEKIPAILERLATCAPGLYERKIWETDGQVRPDQIYHTGFYEDNCHAYVVISEGCSNFCTYCVVPYVRGSLHNRDSQAILREIEEALKRGINRITLLGQNVSAYRNLDIDFVMLLERAAALRGIEEIGFITSHPRDTQTALFQAMAKLPNVKKYLHLPVQSGSDRILETMGRGYTRKFYLDLIEHYRTIVPGGVLTTDVIVGFPGETKQDFQDTVALLGEVRFDAAFIFKYSPRPRTQAANLPDDVPRPEKERRHAIILELQKKISKNKAGK